MDIKILLKDERMNEEEIMIERLKTVLYNMVECGYMDTLQYTWWIEFIRLKGTINGINLLIDQVNAYEKKDTDDQNCLYEFKKNICLVFSKIFREEDKKIRINRNIQYNASRVHSIQFTKEQKRGVKNMLHFLIDGEKKSYGLYGYAGTGKTTTIVEFVSYLLKNRLICSIALSAPTNKAVNVIKAKFKPHLKEIVESVTNKKIDSKFNFDDCLILLESHNIHINLMTIHKLLCFQTDYSVDGDTIFVRDMKKGSLIGDYDLCVIDECSMIGTDMIDSIFDELRNFEKNGSGRRKKFKRVPKIIFSGDPAQLPPVNEDYSCIFCNKSDQLAIDRYVDQMSYNISNAVVSDTQTVMHQMYQILQEELIKMETYTLKNVCRSKLDIVTRCCLEFRNWVISDQMPDLKKFTNHTGIGFYDAKKTTDKTKTDWFEKFLQNIQSNEQCIIISWTNKQTDQYNEAVRRKLFNKKLKKFVIGDILMLSDFYNLDLGDDFVAQRLYTSEQIKITSAEIKNIPINVFKQLTHAGLKNMKQYRQIQEQLNVLIDGLNKTYFENTVFRCWVLGVVRFGEDTHNQITIVVVDDQDIAKYETIKNETNLIIKNFTKLMINRYKATPKQIEGNLIKPLWKQWHKIIIDPFANVNYGYSITCHKAQGSNFYNVYVDLDDILQNKKSLDGRKCAYTALTRTCNELHILT